MPEDQVDEFLTLLLAMSQQKLRQDQQRQRDLQRRVDELRLRSTLPTKRSPLKPEARAEEEEAERGGSLNSPAEIPKLLFNRSKPPLPTKKHEVIVVDSDDEDAPPLPQRKQRQQRPLASQKREERQRKRSQRKPTLESHHDHPVYSVSDDDGPPLPRRKPQVYTVDDSDDEEEAREQRGREEEEAPPLPRRREGAKEETPPALPRRRDTSGAKPALEETTPVSRDPKPKPTAPPARKTAKSSGASLLSQWTPPASAVVRDPTAPKKPPRSFVEMEQDLRSGKAREEIAGPKEEHTKPAKPTKPTKPDTAGKSGQETTSLKLAKPEVAQKPSKPPSKPIAPSKPGKPDAAPTKPGKPDLKLASSDNDTPTKPSKPLWKSEHHEEPEELPSKPKKPSVLSQPSTFARASTNPAPAKPSSSSVLAKMGPKPVPPKPRVSPKYDEPSEFNTSPVPDLAAGRTSPKKGWLSLLATNPKTTSTTQESQAPTPISPQKSPAKGGWMASLSSNSKTTSHHQLALWSPEDADPATPSASHSPSKSPSKTNWMSSLSRNSTVTKQAPPSKPAYLRTKPAPATPKPEPEEELPAKSPHKASWIDSALKKSDSNTKFEDAYKPNFQITKTSKPIPEEPPEKEPEFLKATLRKSPEKPAPAPKAPSKPEYLSQLEKIKTTPAPPKPAKPTAPAVSQDEQTLQETMLKLGKSKPPAPPPKPRYDEDEKLLQLQMRSLLPSKRDQARRPSYLEKDAAELRSQMLRLGQMPLKVNQREKQKETIEGLEALNKLKHSTPASKPAPAAKPEALARLGLLKHLEPAKKKAKEPEPDFKLQLSNMLKAPPRASPSATPSGTPSPTVAMSGPKKTDTKGDKLTHATKNRAKGPKRRLPRAATSELLSSLQPPLRGISRGGTDSSIALAPAALSSDRKPPPLPKKKPEIQSRQFSGEVFI